MCRGSIYIYVCALVKTFSFNFNKIISVKDQEKIYENETQKQN